MNRRLTITLLTATLYFSFTTIYSQPATPSTFIVFVGEKISFEAIQPKDGEIRFDKGFKAKYRILKKLYGNYSADTIEFESYTHKENVPGFAQCRNPLLYLSIEDGKWYQEKYQYDEVFPTKNGRWAGVGKSWEYGHSNNKDIKLEPENILFVDGKTALGNYAEDLFYLRRKGVLGARGLF
jgi:hypothetical protein